jgi:23S rRNA (adenine1618-N6)-methyltransferase
MLTGHGFAMRNVWSRQARRRKKRGRLEEEPDEQEEIDEDEAALGIRVLLRQSKQEKSAEIVIRWLKGNDEVLFESFCGMLHRKLEKR